MLEQSAHVQDDLGLSLMPGRCLSEARAPGGPFVSVHSRLDRHLAVGGARESSDSRSL